MKQTMNRTIDVKAVNQSVDVTGDSKAKPKPNSKYIRNSIQDYEMAKVRQKK